MNWNQEIWYEPAASRLSLKRYRKLCEFLHVVDNIENDKPESKGDKCFKVKQLLEGVRANCKKTEPNLIPGASFRYERKAKKRDEDGLNQMLNTTKLMNKHKKGGGVCQYNP